MSRTAPSHSPSACWPRSRSSRPRARRTERPCRPRLRPLELTRRQRGARLQPRASDGTLSGPVSYPTGGTGTGGGLGSQGAIILDGDDLYAVNAGSNSITRFSVHRSGLEWEATVPSGGTMPISLTVHGHLLYVLNGGAPTNITGFDTHGDGLAPIPELDPRDGPGRVRPGPDLVQPQRRRARRHREVHELDRDLLRRQRRPGRRRRVLLDRRHAVRLRLRQARQPAHLERVRLRLLVQPEPRGPRQRDQRRRADRPGRAVLARHLARTAATPTPRTAAAARSPASRSATTAASPCSPRAAPRRPSARARTRSTRRSRRTAATSTT